MKQLFKDVFAEQLEVRKAALTINPSAPQGFNPKHYRNNARYIVVGDLKNPKLTASNQTSGWIAQDSHDHNVNSYLVATLSDDNGFKGDIKHGASARTRVSPQTDYPVHCFLSDIPLQAQKLNYGDSSASLHLLKAAKSKSTGEYSNWDGKAWLTGTYEVCDIVLIDLCPPVELRRALTKHSASDSNSFAGLHGKSELSKLVLKQCGGVPPLFTGDSTADCHHVLGDKELCDKYLLANSAYLLGVAIKRDVQHLGKQDEADQLFRAAYMYCDKLFRSVSKEFPNSVLKALAEAVLKLHRPERNGSKKRAGGHGGYTAGDREQKKAVGRVDELMVRNNMPPSLDLSDSSPASSLRSGSSVHPSDLSEQSSEGAHTVLASEWRDMKNKWEKSQTELNQANQQKKKKQDTIDGLRKQNKEEIAELTSPLKEEIAELKKKVTALKKEGTQNVKNMRLEKGKAEDAGAVNVELKEEVNDLKKEVAACKKIPSCCRTCKTRTSALRSWSNSCWTSARTCKLPAPQPQPLRALANPLTAQGALCTVEAHTLVTICQRHQGQGTMTAHLLSMISAVLRTQLRSTLKNTALANTTTETRQLASSVFNNAYCLVCNAQYTDPLFVPTTLYLELPMKPLSCRVS